MSFLGNCVILSEAKNLKPSQNNQNSQFLVFSPLKRNLAMRQGFQPLSDFREQLSLEIGRFYSQQSSDVKSHIPFF